MEGEQSDKYIFFSNSRYECERNCGQSQNNGKVRYGVSLMERVQKALVVPAIMLAEKKYSSHRLRIDVRMRREIKRSASRSENRGNHARTYHQHILCLYKNSK